MPSSCGAQATQHGAGQGCAEGGTRAQRLEGQARQAVPEGPGRPVDEEARPCAAPGGRRPERPRDHGARVQLQEPRFHRPAPWPDPQVGGYARGSQRRSATPRSGRPGQHAEPTVGGYALSLAPQRGPAGTLGPRLQDPLPQATGEDHAGTEGQRQCRAHQGPLSDRARFRPSERADELVRFTIGIARARTEFDIVNLAYNMRRFVRLERSPAPA